MPLYTWPQNYACKRQNDKLCDGWTDTIVFTEYMIICRLGLIVSAMLLLYMLYSIFLPIYMHIYSTCQLLWALACLKSKHVGWSFVYFKHASREGSIDLYCIWIPPIPLVTLRFLVTSFFYLLYLLFYFISLIFASLHCLHVRFIRFERFLLTYKTHNNQAPSSNKVNKKVWIEL